MSSSEPLHPGIILKRKFLEPLEITPYRLAKAIGVHVRRVSELVNGRRSLTPDTAQRLGLYFDVPAIWWLRMQADYDVALAENLDELRRVVKPYPGLADVLVSPRGIRKLEKRSKGDTSAHMVKASDEFLSRLRNQAAQDSKTAMRDVRTVQYENGATALVGETK